MRTAILKSIPLVLSLLLAGAAHAQVKLAVAGPVTGANAAFGAQLTQGVQQAVEDINKAGGIFGQKIEVEIGDDVSDPKQGVSVANKFVGDGVKFVVGHFNSGVTMPASDVYAENGVLFITPSATNPKITDRKLWDAFRTCGRDDQQGMVWAELARDKLKGKKIAVIHDKTTYGKGLADAALDNMHKFGVKEVLYEGVNTGEKDYSAIVSKIKDSGADYLMWGGLHTEGGLILRQMRDQGMKTVMISGDGITDSEFAAIGGPGRRRHADDLRSRAAQQSEREGGGRFVQGQGVRPAGLHPLLLRRGPDHEAGGGEGEVARSEEGRGSDAFRHALPHRHRRHFLRQEGRPHDRRLRLVRLEERRRRQDRVRPALKAVIRATAAWPGSPSRSLEKAPIGLRSRGRLRLRGRASSPEAESCRRRE